jgi:hydroxylamine dehydrogenase
VHEYEMSIHAQQGINCLDCHQPVKGHKGGKDQQGMDHHGFVISTTMTAANCRSCHVLEYEQFLRSRHAAPSWAAVYGEKSIPADHVAYSEKFHPGGCKRAEHPLVGLEVAGAGASGCAKCHSIGKPNQDGTIGTCTSCHTRHTASVAIARLPTTCGQCHMGPDHSQLEIYHESKHGVMFTAQQHLLKLDAKPAKLSTKDMFIPTCSTCHMSGLNSNKVTHDTTERLSWLLADEISRKRENYTQGQIAMKEVCSQCHTPKVADKIYAEAEKIVESTNKQVKEIKDIYLGLKEGGLIPGKPFSHPVDFKYFDLWHYYGRTIKHGAFMGGQDFTQWHGAYPLLQHSVEIRAIAKELKEHGKSK